jgi:hypothetical protein
VVLLPFLFTRSLNAEALEGLSRTLEQTLSSRTEEGTVRG